MKQGDRWIIFYTDGRTFTHLDGSPWDAPRRSVQRIASARAEKHDDWYNVQQYDYFYWEEDNGGWNGGDNFTIWDHLLRAKYPCVIFGRMLSDEGWQDCHKAMNKFCEQHRDFILGRTDERPPKNYL
jgi:hypothetical protein